MQAIKRLALMLQWELCVTIVLLILDDRQMLYVDIKMTSEIV